MRVKLDENMPGALIELLCFAGHDVTTAHDENLSGVNDLIVLRTAAQESRLLMTFDVGFGDIRSFPLGSHAGIVVFRLKDQPVLEDTLTSLQDAGMRLVLQPNIHQKFAVVDQKIVWYGSINFLSYGNAQESIMRLESPNIAQELMKDLEKSIAI